jgi:hypothetical protein
MDWRTPRRRKISDSKKKSRAGWPGFSCVELDAVTSLRRVLAPTGWARQLLVRRYESIKKERLLVKWKKQAKAQNKGCLNHLG